MNKTATSLLFVLSLLSLPTWAQTMTETSLSCQDFRPTEEALQRFPDLVGACEAVVDHDGELYGRFSAVVRRASYSSVTLYLPATDHTFKVNPKSDARVLIGGRKVRARDLQRGQEIQIYLSARQFSRPDIEEVALVTETELMIEHPVEEVAALPTTASPWPAVTLISLALLGTGAMARRRRVIAKG
jgi:hypothetical protein